MSDKRQKNPVYVEWRGHRGRRRCTFPGLKAGAGAAARVGQEAESEWKASGVGQMLVEWTEDRMRSPPFMVLSKNSSPDEPRSTGGILGDGGYDLLSGVIRHTCRLLWGIPSSFLWQMIHQKRDL